MANTKVKAKVVASKGKGSVKPKLRDNKNGGILTAKVVSIVNKKNKGNG